MVPKPMVYVVDDEPIIADTISAYLRNEGFRVRTFYDGDEVMGQVCDVPPDVVVTDYVMPHINGLALSHWLQVKYPECDVILFSGSLHLLPAAVTKVLEDRPHFTMLSKPMAPAKLLAAIRHITGPGCCQVAAG